MPNLKWTDADEIGFQLNRRFPDTDPLSVRFTDLRRWVMGLEGFDDDPGASGEAVLETIQAAWSEYHAGGCSRE